MSKRFAWILSKAAICGMLLWATTAWGALCPSGSFSSPLDANNLSLTDGPFGTVCVTLTNGGASAQIVFTAISGFLFTDGGSIAANGNFTFASVTGNCPSGTYTNSKNTQEDGFGNFTVAIDSGDSSSDSQSTTIILNVTKSTSGTWASAADVLTDNGSGYDAAAHIYVARSGTGTGLTGYAAESTGGGTIVGSVPEPSSIVLFGGVALAIVNVARKRHARAQQNS